MATDSFPALVNSSYLYNLILSSSFLVIDVRSADDYEKKHVRTAISVPMQRLLSEAKATASPLSLGAIDSSIQRHHQNAWKGRARSRIVLYDDNQTSDHLVTTLARFLRDERSSCVRTAISEPTSLLETNRSVDGALCSATPSCSSPVPYPIHILEGGFAAFQTRFPFLCVETPTLLRTSSEPSAAGGPAAGSQEAKKSYDPVHVASPSSDSQHVCRPPLPPPPIGTKIPVTRKTALPLTTVVSSLPSLQIQENHVYPNEIIKDFLYLGSRDTATDRIVLSQLKITHILNMAGEIEAPFQDEFTYLHFNLDDTKMDDVAQYFEQIYDFLVMVASKSERVLVHCAMGISRSSAAAILYLMKSRRWDLARAHQFVKDCRPYIKPNPGFLRQLLLVEKNLGFQTPSLQFLSEDIYEWRP